MHKAGLCLLGPHINPHAPMDLRAALRHLGMDLAPSRCSRDALKETEQETLESSVHNRPGSLPC